MNKTLGLVAACLIAATASAQAISPIREAYLRHVKGLDTERLRGGAAHAAAKAAKTLHHIKKRTDKKRAIWHGRKAAIRSKRAKLGLKAKSAHEENIVVRREAAEEAAAEIGNILSAAGNEIDTAFIMDTVYGTIDGVTAVFSNNCRGGLFGTIGSTKAVLDNMAFVIPDQLMKFQIATTNLQEAGNVVFATCDLTPMISGVAQYADYYHWENYITIGSRIGGYMISDFWVEKECIDEGSAAGLGYDVGRCAGNMVSAITDVQL